MMKSFANAAPFVTGTAPPLTSSFMSNTISCFLSRSEVFNYQTAGDSTLGQKPVKREHPADEDGGETSAKRIKLEDGAKNVSVIFFLLLCGKQRGG